jgi:hypothetical protein
VGNRAVWFTSALSSSCSPASHDLAPPYTGWPLMMSSAVATHAVAGGCRPLRRASTSAVRVPPTSTASRRPRVRHVCGTQPPLPGPEHPEHPERALLRRMARRVCRQRLRANPRMCKVLVMHADTQLRTPLHSFHANPTQGCQEGDTLQFSALTAPLFLQHSPHTYHWLPPTSCRKVAPSLTLTPPTPGWVGLWQ